MTKPQPMHEHYKNLHPHFLKKPTSILTETLNLFALKNVRDTNDRDIHKHDMYKRNDNPLSPLKYKLAS